MVRIARVVVPGVPHHITQRGNRRHERTGRPLGSESLVARMETLIGHLLCRQKPGPQTAGR